MIISLGSTGIEGGDSKEKGGIISTKLEGKGVWLGKGGCRLLRHPVPFSSQISFLQGSLDWGEQPQWYEWALTGLSGSHRQGCTSAGQSAGRKAVVSLLSSPVSGEWLRTEKTHQSQVILTVGLPQINSLTGIHRSRLDFWLAVLPLYCNQD